MLDLEKPIVNCYQIVSTAVNQVHNPALHNPRNFLSQVIQKLMLNKDNLNSLTSCLPSSLLRSICLLAMLQWLETIISDIYFQFSPKVKCAVMAEWLRRLTRNQMGSSRVGSNPADCVNFLSQVIQKANVEQRQLELANILFAFMFS